MGDTSKSAGKDEQAFLAAPEAVKPQSDAAARRSDTYRKTAEIAERRGASGLAGRFRARAKIEDDGSRN